MLKKVCYWGSKRVILCLFCLFVSKSATTTNMDLGDNTALTPHNIYTFSAAFTPGKLNIRLDGRQISELYNKDEKDDKMDDYSLIDLTCGYKLNSNISLSLSVENISDAAYEVVKGYPTPGRAVFFGLTYNN